jgi:predicted MPP superfamily phosphohydrolase
MTAKRIFPFVLTGGMFVCAFVSCTTIHTEIYRVETASLAEGSRIKIIVISDLHSTIHGKDQSPLINKIKAEKPDLILLTGDIFDDVIPATGTDLLLSGICTVSPVYSKVWFNTPELCSS